MTSWNLRINTQIRTSEVISRHRRNRSWSSLRRKFRTTLHRSKTTSFTYRVYRIVFTLI
jgi:hypothetical protein